MRGHYVAREIHSFSVVDAPVTDRWIQLRVMDADVTVVTSAFPVPLKNASRMVRTISAVVKKHFTRIKSYTLWSVKQCDFYFCDGFDLTLIMVALCNRADHYIFILFLSFFFLLLLFFPRLISAVGDWMSTIIPHMVWP